MNKDDWHHSILTLKDSQIEKLHETIGELEDNLKRRVEYESDLKRDSECTIKYLTNSVTALAEELGDDPREWL